MQSVRTCSLHWSAFKVINVWELSVEEELITCSNFGTFLTLKSLLIVHSTLAPDFTGFLHMGWWWPLLFICPPTLRQAWHDPWSACLHFTVPNMPRLCQLFSLNFTGTELFLQTPGGQPHPVLKVAFVMAARRGAGMRWPNHGEDAAWTWGAGSPTWPRAAIPSHLCFYKFQSHCPCLRFLPQYEWNMINEHLHIPITVFFLRVFWERLILSAQPTVGFLLKNSSTNVRG